MVVKDNTASMISWSYRNVFRTLVAPLTMSWRKGTKVCAWLCMIMGSLWAFGCVWSAWKSSTKVAVLCRVGVAGVAGTCIYCRRKGTKVCAWSCWLVLLWCFVVMLVDMIEWQKSSTSWGTKVAWCMVADAVCVWFDWMAVAWLWMVWCSVWALCFLEFVLLAVWLSCMCMVFGSHVLGQI